MDEVLFSVDSAEGAKNIALRFPYGFDAAFANLFLPLVKEKRHAGLGVSFWLYFI